MSKVLVFGAFDGLTPGHILFLEQASKFGDELVVAVLGDEFYVKYRGQPPSLPLKKRMVALRQLPLNPAVCEEDVREDWRSLQELQPDVIVLSAEQAKWRHRLDELLAKYQLPTRVEVLGTPEAGKSAPLADDVDPWSETDALP